MAGESVKDLVVRLAFEHGDTKQQISAITNELKQLDSGLAASAAVAAGFSGTLNQVKAEGEGLKQAISLQKQMIDKYGEAIEKANERLRKSTEAHSQHEKEIARLKGEQAELAQEKEKLAAAMEAEKKAAGDNSMAYLEMDARMDELNASIKENADALKAEEASLARSDKGINRNAQSVMRLTTEQNKAKVALADMEKQLKNHAPLWTRAAEAADKFAQSAKNAGQWQEKTGQKLTRVSTAILGLGYASAEAAIDWESSFAGVRKTVNGTEEDLQRINDALLDMEVPTDYGDLADIAANAGQLGIATPNVVNFTRTMADLAETTDLTADAAATGFAQYANITNMPQENIGRLGSVTVELGNNLATTESKIVDFAQAIGAAGHQAGMTDAQIFGISGGLASLGLEAQAGGTAFSKAIIGMQVAVETGSEDLQKYASVAGMTAEQFAESFRADAAGTFIKFVQGLSSGSQSAIVMLDEMGITEMRLRDTLLRASNASDLMTRSVKMANQAWTENTALSNEASVRYNTTASRMQMAGKQAQRVAMDFGKTLMPYLEKGLDGLQGIIDKFNGLSDAQRDGIVKWAAYAAAVGPALTLLGKANTTIGNVAGGFSQLAGAIANGGGLTGFMSTLGGLLGPAGIAALIAGLGLAVYKFADYASGAKAAREAQEALNAVAKEWADTQAATLYDTGTADPLARFGLTKDAFGASKKDAEDWMASLVATWTDGKAETNAIVKEYVDSFAQGSDDVRKAIEGQGDLLTEYGALTPEAKANMDADLKALDEYDREVAELLKKRQNGMLSEEDQARLNEIIEARAQIQLKYELDTDGYDQIITQMNAEIERLKAAGEGGGDTGALMGDTLNALAAGRMAYMDALAQSYDAEYARIQLIEDETARQAALNALNEKYNKQRQDDEEAYASAVRDAATAAWEDGGYKEQVAQIDQLVGMLTDADGLDLTGIADFSKGLDEGKLASMIALVEQLKSTDLTDQQLLDMGIDAGALEKKIQAIRDMTQGVEGLEGLNAMFGTALPEEIQRIMVGLDMTQAAADWAAFAAGGDLAPITPTLGEMETATIDLSGSINDVSVLPGVTCTVDGKGNITSATTADGVTFTADGDGNITSVQTADGSVFEVDGTGHITDVAVWPGVSFETDGDGNIIRVTTADGVTFTADGDGNITSVTLASGVEIPRFSATASVRLNPIDQAAVAAWRAQNSGIALTGPTAKVGVKLGADWQSDLQKAWNEGLLTVYGPDGLPITVTPEVLEKITATDVAMLGEDGTIHVVITPEMGTPEAVEQSTTQIETAPMAGTPLSFISQSTMDEVRQISALNESIERYKQLAREAAEAGDVSGSAMFDEEANNLVSQQVELYRDLSETDLSAIGGQIANLMAALSSGEGSPEQVAEWQGQLEELLSFVAGIDPSQYTSTGVNVMEGIAQGMEAYGWDGDGSAVAGAIQAAINGALQINSPSRLMNPTGSGVAEGIAQGMKGYSFAADASAIASGIVGAFGGLAGQGEGIGSNFGAGLHRGLSARLPGIVAQAKTAANEIAAAFRTAWQIHSPSRVAEGLTEMFGRGLEKGMRDWPTVSERVLENDVANLRRGMGAVVNQNTDSRDMSVANEIRVEKMEVKDQSDIYGVSRDLYQLIRRDQRLIGAR